MANLKGPGSMKGVNLVVVTYPSNVTKDGKTQYLDVQVDARDSRGAGQTNLHLVMNRTTDPKTGKTRIGNGAPYSMDQFTAIKEATGDNAATLPSGAMIYAVKADVMPSSRNSGLVLNSKTLAASDFTIDDKVIDNQIASAKEAKAAKAAEAKAAEAQEAKAAEAQEAKTAETQATAPQAEAASADVSLDKVDEPALG